MAVSRFVADYLVSDEHGRRVAMRVALNAETRELALEEIAALHLETDGRDPAVLAEVTIDEWEAVSSAPDLWPTDEVTIGKKAKALERYGHLTSLALVVLTVVFVSLRAPQWLINSSIGIACLVTVPTMVLETRRRWFGQ